MDGKYKRKKKTQFDFCAHCLREKLHKKIRFKRGDHLIICCALVSDVWLFFDKWLINFNFGRFIHPITYGDYPKSMRTLVGKRLPKFTTEQAKLLKGSYDFIGLNYYIANYASNVRFANSVNLSYSTDSLALQTSEYFFYNSDVQTNLRSPQYISDVPNFTTNSWGATCYSLLLVRFSS